MSDDNQFPRDLTKIRAIVQEKLETISKNSRDAWTHVSGGCETGATWKRNMQAFESIGFNMKAISDVNKQALDLSVDLFGIRLDIPIAIAPMSAGISNVCDDAFLEMARGAKVAGTLASIGYPSGSEIVTRMHQAGAPVFRIVKPLRDIQKLVDASRDSETSGCIAAGIDIDSVAGLKPAGDACLYDEMTHPLSVDAMRGIREAVRIPFIVKGVMSVEDALSAMEIGADAIVVSNHAGFSLDYCPAPIEVLPRITKAVGGKMKILLDSGIRRGSDIVKALALGADAVLIGRLALWGLIMGKGEGLAWILKLLADEIKRIMVLTGANRLSDLTEQSLVALDDVGERILRSV